MTVHPGVMVIGGILFGAAVMGGGLLLGSHLLERNDAITVWQSPAVVVDGDTLTLKQGKVRLFGIDAFETDQTCQRRSYEDGTIRRRYSDALLNKPAPEIIESEIACGELAATHLFGLVGTGTVTCVGDGFDRYGRLLATCSTDSHADLGGRMVFDGWALAYLEYSRRYVEREDDARKTRQGVWANVGKPEIVPPWQWRKDHP